MKSFISILALAALAASGTALACDDGYAMSDDGIATKAPEKPVVLADKASTSTPLVVKQKQPVAARKAQGKPLPNGVSLARTSQ